MASGTEEYPGQTPAQQPAGAAASHKWWVLVSIGIGTFMSALDGSVVNSILPVIGQTLHPSAAVGSGLAGSQVAAVEWVVTVYLLVLSGLLLGFGRLGDLQGHKNVYIAGFFIFMASSALCGLAGSIPMLVFFRALQAIGAAMLSANSPAILTKSFPASMRGRALGLQATMTYMGLTVGPSLGGWLADQFTWRSVFYINVPVAILALGLSLRYIPADKPQKVGERFDWGGALVFMTGLVSLLLGLNQGHALGWASPTILALLGGALLLIALFIRLELRQAAPMLDLSLFTSRTFSASVTSAVLNYMCVYSITFLLPFFLIQGLGYNTSQSGLTLSAMPLVMAVVAPFSGALSDRIGARSLSITGMLLIMSGLLLLAGLGPGSSQMDIAWRLMVCGLGIGIFISPNNSALMGAAPRRRQGIAAAIMATARNVGMVLGIGITGAIFTTALAQASAAAQNSLFAALRTSFLFAAGFAALGMLASAIHSKENSNQVDNPTQNNSS